MATRATGREDQHNSGGRSLGSGGSAGGTAGRRKALAVALTVRDLAIIRDLARYGALSAEQVRRRHFPATGEGTRTALNRLRQLRLAGYVVSVPLGYHLHGAYLATTRGIAHAGGGLPAVRLWADGNPRPVAPPWVAHALAVADVAEHLLSGKYHGGAAAWHTERELARGAVPGLEHGPRPDGVLTLTPPEGTALHMAVEVELTPKPAADYPAKVAHYGKLLADGTLARVRWYVGDDGTRRVVERALRSGKAPAIMTVEPLPK